MNAITSQVNEPGLSVETIQGLYTRMSQLEDKRKRRGKRYPLAVVLTWVVLAKLCGENEVRGIAEWVQLRGSWLISVFCLKHSTLPHWTTYSRILSTAIDVEAFEQQVGQFFQQRCLAQEAVALDGKSLRGTRTANQAAQHLLAAYGVETGGVLEQAAVETKANEITTAPDVLKAIPLAGRVVTGDAMFTQRALSEQIVAAKGAYLWVVKDNQPQLLAAIHRLFAPERCLPGHSPMQTDFETATTTDKQHGRVEYRRLTVSSLLKPYSDWPHLEQVFRLERRVVKVATGEIRAETVYGLTSLSRAHANADRLLCLVRSHWRIENCLHYVRDVTLREDACRLLARNAQRVLAVVNNLVIGLCSRAGFASLPSARRYFAAHLAQALALLF